MKILLVGEYSRLHNSLKEGLEKLGHDVTLLASGDGFKNYPADIKIHNPFDNGFLKKLNVLTYKIFNIKLSSIYTYHNTKKHIHRLPQFDIIQLINETPFKTTTEYEKKLISLLRHKTNKLFLLSCGEDYTTMKYFLEDKPRYSIMTPFLQDPNLKKVYQFQLKRVSDEHKTLHEFLHQHIDGLIASDLDYHEPNRKHKNYLGVIPNPINIDKLEYIEPKINQKIKIFHGVNKASVHKKGNDFFFEATERIKKLYSDRVEIFTVYSLPYDEYIKTYDACHILLDQVYSYDQGYNALEAMAKGKVVFTGAEQEWLEHYKLEPDTVAINALPDSNAIFKKLEWLILNPNEIFNISKNARAFIETHHHYVNVAQQYLNAWKSNTSK